MHCVQYKWERWLKAWYLLTERTRIMSSLNGLPHAFWLETFQSLLYQKIQTEFVDEIYKP